MRSFGKALKGCLRSLFLLLFYDLFIDELSVKLLSKHKNTKIKYLCGSSSVGKSIDFFDKSLINKKLPKIQKFDKNFLKHVDLVFTALPNGQAQKLSNSLLKNNKLIDLSADFRLKTAKQYLKWYNIKHNSPKNINKSIYALSEFSKKNIKKFKIISCPGCYPTSILLPLKPLIQKKINQDWRHRDRL